MIGHVPDDLFDAPFPLSIPVPRLLLRQAGKEFDILATDKKRLVIIISDEADVIWETRGRI
jgi:hypothetical protein